MADRATEIRKELIRRELARRAQQANPQTMAGPALQESAQPPAQQGFWDAISDKMQVGNETHTAQGLSGINSGMARFAGTPVDAANWLVNKGKEGINAVAGTNMQPTERPYLGSEHISDMMGDGAIRPESQDPNLRMTRRIGEEIGASIIPAGGVAAKSITPLKTLAQMGLSALSSGTAAASANRVAPDSPNLEMVAQIVGGFTPYAFQSALRKNAARIATKARLNSVRPARLKRQADRAWDKVDNNPATYKQSSIKSMVDEAIVDAKKSGFHPVTSEGANVGLKELKNLAKSTATSDDLQTVRRVVDSGYEVDMLTGIGKKTNNAIVNDMKRKLEKLAGDPTAIVSGNARKTAAAQRAARKATWTVKKLEDVDMLADDAALIAASVNSGQNEVNKIRQKLRTLIQSNAKKGRAFTALEKKKMRQIVMGTPHQNKLRKWTKRLSTDGLMGGVNTSVSAGLGGGVGSVVGSVFGMPYQGAAIGAATGAKAVNVVGDMIKNKSLQSTADSVQKLRYLIANGQVPQQVLQSVPPDLLKQILAATAAQSASRGNK